MWLIHNSCYNRPDLNFKHSIQPHIPVNCVSLQIFCVELIYEWYSITQTTSIMQYIRIKCTADHHHLSNLKSLLYIKNLNTLNEFCKKYIFQSLLAIYDIQVYGVLKYISIHHQSTNCISLCYILLTVLIINNML